MLVIWRSPFLSVDNLTSTNAYPSISDLPSLSGNSPVTFSFRTLPASSTHTVSETTLWYTLIVCLLPFASVFVSVDTTTYPSISDLPSVSGFVPVSVAFNVLPASSTQSVVSFTTGVAFLLYTYVLVCVESSVDTLLYVYPANVFCSP